MEQTSSKTFLVVTPRVIEVWQARSRPRVKVSRALAEAKTWGYRRGRRVRIKQPVELVKYDIHSSGKRLIKKDMNWAGILFPASVGLSRRVTRKFTWIKYGHVDTYKGERYICTQITPDQVQRTLQYLGE